MNFIRYLICLVFKICALPSPVNDLKAVLNQKGRNMSTATLTWTVPTTRTDGTPLSAAEIAMITIFDAGVQIGTVTGAGSTFTTGVLTVGDHVFTVTVTDTTGHVSALSNAVTVTVVAVLAPPSAVTNLAAVLNS